MRLLQQQQQRQEEEEDSRGKGMRKAREREMVRRAGRRGVVFGFLVEGEGGGGDGDKGEKKRRMVDAVQGGRVVESSFAKGEWGVRWR